VAATTDVVAILSRLSRDCLKFDTAIPTIGSKIEVGNAPKADIERLDLKCREVGHEETHAPQQNSGRFGKGKIAIGATRRRRLAAFKERTEIV
jgi:hypothetical protein